MNSELFHLYTCHWNNYLNNVRDNCAVPAAFPYLITVQDSYTLSSKRIMICGQETQGWGNELDNLGHSVSVDQVLEIYKGFVWTDGYNSPYWQFVKGLKKGLPGNGFVINNLVKIGKRYGPGCDEEINNRALLFFPINREEMSILKPDIIIFLTGPSYDKHIQNVFGPFKPIVIRQGLYCLDNLLFEDTTMPKAIRSYHPAYLRRRKLSLLYMKEIIDYCQKCNDNQL